MYTLDIVIPAYNEAESIGETLKGIEDHAPFGTRVSVVVDSWEDSTIEAVRKTPTTSLQVRYLVQRPFNGPANAIKYGLQQATAPYAIIMMGDGSDDPETLSPMLSLLESGVAIACASRYMAGGRQLGGPWLKGRISKGAGFAFHYITGVGTLDATNCFKGFSRDFLSEIEIESDTGFEIGIELLAKGVRMRRRVEEVPTIWRDRKQGESRFQLFKWLPLYSKWFIYGVRKS